MGGRSIYQIMQELGRGLLDDMPTRQRGMATRDIERAASSASRLPRAGETMTVRGLPPSQQPKSEMLDPRGYGKLKLSRPIEAYTPTVVERNQPMLPRNPLSLEALENAYIMGLWGDRSSGAGLLTRVGDMDLQRAYNLEGGVDFMRGPANQADRAIWASGGGVMKPIVSRAEEIADATGKPVYGVTISMAPNALDFAKFTPRVAADLMQQSMTLKAAKTFDEAVRALPKMGEWPGIKSPDLDAWLQGATPDQQKAFMRFADSKEGLAAGAPPDAIAAARYAVTDPTQRHMGSGVGGLGVSRFDYSGGLLEDPTVPHSSYPVQARGEYMGSLEIPLSQEFLLKDAFKRYFSPDYVNTSGNVGPMTLSQATYTAKLNNPVQLVTPQMVDDYGRWVESARSEGLLD